MAEQQVYNEIITSGGAMAYNMGSMAVTYRSPRFGTIYTGAETVTSSYKILNLNTSQATNVNAFKTIPITYRFVPVCIMPHMLTLTGNLGAVTVYAASSGLKVGTTAYTIKGGPGSVSKSNTSGTSSTTFNGYCAGSGSGANNGFYISGSTTTVNITVGNVGTGGYKVSYTNASGSATQETSTSVSKTVTVQSGTSITISKNTDSVSKYYYRIQLRLYIDIDSLMIYGSMSAFYFGVKGNGTAFKLVKSEPSANSMYQLGSSGENPYIAWWWCQPSSSYQYVSTYLIYEAAQSSSYSTTAKIKQAVASETLWSVKLQNTSYGGYHTGYINVYSSSFTTGYNYYLNTQNQDNWYTDDNIWFDWYELKTSPSEWDITISSNAPSHMGQLSGIPATGTPLGTITTYMKYSQNSW